jgi:cation transport ATPase
MGSDVLAVLALLGALFTNELFAAAVISVMLCHWSRVRELGRRSSRTATEVTLSTHATNGSSNLPSDGTIEEIEIEIIQIGDRLLIRSGEITPTDGSLLGLATLNESALTESHCR